MTDLPQGWCQCTVGDLADYVTSGSRDWSQYYSNNGALFVRTQDINTNKIGTINEIARVSLPPSVEGKRTRIYRDDLLITITGANVGKCAHVSEELPEAYVSQSIALVRLLDPSLAEFVHRQLISASLDDGETALERSAYGLGRPVLNLDNVKHIELRLAPLAEQQRIVVKIDSLSAKSKRASDQLDHIPRLVEKYKQAILATAFRGDLTIEWRAHQSKLTSIVARDEPDIRRKIGSSSAFEPPYAVPPSWRWLRLPELGDIDRGRSRHRPRNDPRLFDGRYPFIQTGDIRAADRFLTTYTQTYSEFGLSQSRLWPVGTLCITIAANIAETALLTVEACFPDSVVGFLADTDRVDASYVEFFLRTARAELEAFAPATAQKNINLDTLSSIRVPVPGLDEQRMIVRRIETAFAWINRLASEATSARKLIDHLDQTLLAKAFRGELVPQDPNDEPASVLLERIREERQATGAPGHRKEQQKALRPHRRGARGAMRV